MRITQWLFKLTSSSMANSKRGLIAVCQVTSTNNKEKNFEMCYDLVHKAKKFDAQMVFFPEACDFVGISRAETLANSDSLDGPTVKSYQQLARETGLWLSFGGLHERISDEKVYNSHIVISSEGKIEGLYRKLHLFDVDWPEGRVYLKESAYCQGGDDIVPPIKTPVGNVGLAICYDMRFPELAMRLRSLGAEIITYPSAFMFATGCSHWESLLRARAIETQCYVVAAAQSGAHNPKRSSWGHAMVVDPWGTVVAQCSEGNNLAIAEIDLSYMDKVRKSMPVLEHRRDDVYSLISKARTSQTSDPAAIYNFGHVTVPEDCVFYKTQHTIAFTNKKCVVPGHVLIAPIRSAARLADLTTKEVSDLFSVVHRIQPTIESVYNASSSTIVVQDGPEAGQSIKHVHVHILPRKNGDFLQNDDIYRELQKHDKTTGGWRSEKEMNDEAESLRKHFVK